MILADYLLSQPGLTWDYARQCGVNHGVIRLPETPEFDLTDRRHWQEVVDRFLNAGIRPVAIEPMPNALHDHIKAGDALRDASIDAVRRMFPIMDALEIRTICLNFMAHIGWYRTSHTFAERGGAQVTAFRREDFVCPTEACISPEELWGNLEYFLKAVVPEAEKYGIRLAFHPDDPPVAQLGGVSRILISPEAVDKAIHLVESDNVGVCLCQGCYAAMGENVMEVIDRFGAQNKIFMVHFRDVAGTREEFHETFHDNGPTDMAKALEHYRKWECHVPIRIDHVPTMAGEQTDVPGYASIGRLFAIGYLKGLLDAQGYPYI